MGIHSTDGNGRYPTGRHAERDRNALPIFAAYPTTLVELEVIANHIGVLENFGSIPNNVGVFNGLGELAVFYEKASFDVERKITRPDHDLPIGECFRINAILD